MGRIKKSSSEECPPQAHRYINPQDDNWGLRQNVCPLNSPKISTQDNTQALANANSREMPVYGDRDSGYIARSTSGGRK